MQLYTEKYVKYTQKNTDHILMRLQPHKNVISIFLLEALVLPVFIPPVDCPPIVNLMAGNTLVMVRSTFANRTEGALS